MTIRKQSNDYFRRVIKTRKKKKKLIKQLNSNQMIMLED